MAKSATHAVDTNARELERLRAALKDEREKRLLLKTAMQQAVLLCEHTDELLNEYVARPHSWIWRAIVSSQQRLLNALTRAVESQTEAERKDDP